jgi:hypothetical protein
MALIPRVTSGSEAIQKGGSAHSFLGLAMTAKGRCTHF